MTIAEFISLTIIAGPASNWLTMFSQEMARMRTSSASAARVSGFIPESTGEDSGAALLVQDGESAVSFQDVTFGYEDDNPVFDKTSFEVKPGSITAIAGPSGCGKSTALKLMLGLYKPDNGQILLSSKNITYVPQDCQLLPVTLSENITAGLPPDDQKLKQACENAGILGFIQSLADGFDTVLAESAANVSGGQKQRIAMARAFYRDADILLFDEATSALDSDTEQDVLASFSRYIKVNGKTAIVVAHRASVLDISDQVVTFAAQGMNASRRPGEEGRV